MSIRRRLALLICPELASPEKVTSVTSRDQILLSLADQYAAAAAVSDWAIAERAGVNNRAVFLMREGKSVTQPTASALYEFFYSNRRVFAEWPVSAEDEKRFFRVDCIPAIEKVGGHEAVHAIITESGRARTVGAVLTWTRRGVPGYGRRLIEAFARRHGIKLSDQDFELAKLSKPEIMALRASAPRPSTNKEDAA